MVVLECIIWKLGVIMKVEDLMIGDWVRLEDENLPLEEQYFKIEYLAISAGVSWVNQRTNAPIGLGDGESLIPVFADEIYPIPLTSELLEKNGFYRREIPTRDEIGHYYHRTTDPCSIFVRMSFGDGRDFGNEIRYVHDLQHLLKLCGIDKEIAV